MSLVIVSLAIRKAFDTIIPDAIEQLLYECNVPPRLLFAILQEILYDRKFIPLIFGMKGGEAEMHAG